MSRPAASHAVRLGLALLASASLVSCSTFTERKARAERLVDAPRVLAQQGGFTGDLVVTARLVKADGLSASAKQQAKRVETRAAKVTVDLRRELASAVPAGATSPQRVFHNYALYGRRPDARPEDARPWVRINVARAKSITTLDPQDHPPVAGIDVLSPVVLVDLVAGALAGSVRDLGASRLGGVPVRSYSANVDVAKALRKATREDLDERERNGVLDVLHTLGVREEALHRLQLWLDGDGVARRIRLVLREDPMPNVVYEVEFDLRVTSVGAPTRIDRPTLEEEVGVASVSQFLAAVTLTAPKPAASTS